MIQENVRSILSELPAGVQLVGAAKTRTHEEIQEAVESGLEIVGENYVQEAEQAFKIIGRRVKWHMIGHLQTNKVNKAVGIFDMIETVDSLKLARAIDRASEKENKIMAVLIEINSGEETQKTGVMPRDVQTLIKEISGLKRVAVRGLMTMGPFHGNPEKARPYFVRTKEIFEQVKSLEIPNVEMVFLSMGMSNSYKVALEEGANLVRIGTRLFGTRK
jgi:pyridoxal phosphate enzyme (YggS family)